MRLEELLLPPTSTVREAMQSIDRTGAGIALLVDEERRLIATVTDGDLRRAILAAVPIDSTVQALLDRTPRPKPTPLTAPVDTPLEELLRLMSDAVLRQIPLLDDEGRVVDIALLEELVKEYQLPLRAVVMAGGYGRRLGELTEGLPKPMLPVGDRPLLERIIDQLREAGIHRVNLSTHYRGDTIAAHFGDGSDFGVEINYVEEDEPLGTAGALALLQSADEPTLVMNGDVLTRVDFRAMLRFHQEHEAALTVAVRPYEVQVPFGVVATDGAEVRAIEEKPLVKGFVNAGIYLLDPHVQRHVPSGRRFDMPELIEEVLTRGGRVVGFPLHEYWVDIGELEDYRRALLENRERPG